MNLFQLSCDAPYSLLSGKAAFDKPVMNGREYIDACKQFRRHSSIKWIVVAPVRPVNRTLALLARI